MASHERAQAGSRQILLRRALVHLDLAIERLISAREIVSADLFEGEPLADQIEAAKGQVEVVEDIACARTVAISAEIRRLEEVDT